MAVKGLNQLSHCRKDSLICWLLRKGSRNGWCRRRQVIRTDRGGLSVFSQSVPQEQPSVHAHGSIVLAAVPAQSLRSFSGGIRGRAITLSSTPPPVPVPNKHPRFCGRKTKWSIWVKQQQTHHHVPYVADKAPISFEPQSFFFFIFTASSFIARHLYAKNF